MRKIFILGGSQLQMDLILEAKKMFFYTIVLDMDANCIASKWCDEFLCINISDKETVLEKAKEYQIDAILTSATEVGNITACYVGEKLGLNTNSYQTALNTTNKILMKKICQKYNINIAPFTILNRENIHSWNSFPAVVKPSNSSGGRGVSYCKDVTDLENAIKIAKKFSNEDIIIEKYISGEQFSIETISTNGNHQIVSLTNEYIRSIPEIVETHQTIPALVNPEIEQKIEQFTLKILNVFKIKYGACHIEIRVNDRNIYLVEIASRIGGWRSELINFTYGISYSQLLLFSTLNIYRKIIKRVPICKTTVKLVLSYDDYSEYFNYRFLNNNIFYPMDIKDIENSFFGNNICDAKGYYYILENIK